MSVLYLGLKKELWAASLSFLRGLYVVGLLVVVEHI